MSKTRQGNQVVLFGLGSLWPSREIRLKQIPCTKSLILLLIKVCFTMSPTRLVAVSPRISKVAPPKEVKSITELISVLKVDNSGFDEDIWFRGHSNVAWTLSPTLMRLSTAPSEGALLTRFKQSAAMLIGSHPKDEFDWLFLMQHYGVPTRLLDWTESPLAALYFAVEDEVHDSIDGALWSLRPTELNRIANISTSEKNFIPSFEDEELKNYSVQTLRSNTRNKLAPIATIATRNSPRIQAQLGVFTIHHLDVRPIEDFCSGNEVTKYIIPAAAKGVIRNELSLLSITKFTLFPELASIGDIIKRRIK